MKVWTFLLISGEPFRLSLPGNPPLDFQGRRLVWKLVSSQDIADATNNLLKSLGVVFERYCEEQNEEQTQIRKNILEGTGTINAG